jgi:hypothetical protein
MPQAWYNRRVDMLTSRFGARERNFKWNQHVRLFQARRALPPDKPQFSIGVEKRSNWSLTQTRNGYLAYCRTGIHSARPCILGMHLSTR